MHSPHIYDKPRRPLPANSVRMRSHHFLVGDTMTQSPQRLVPKSFAKSVPELLVRGLVRQHRPVRVDRGRSESEGGECKICGLKSFLCQRGPGNLPKTSNL